MTIGRFPLAMPRRTLCAAAAAIVLAPAASRRAVAETVTLRVSIGDLGELTSAIIDSVKAAYSKVPGVTLSITSAPFPRSIGSVIGGAADVHVPMLRPPHGDAAMPFSVTTADEYQVPFVLYTNRDKPVDMHNLGSYKIETDAAHVPYFDFPIIAGAGQEASLRKVAAGRIDGYIFAGNIIDPIVIKLGLTNVRRQLYASYGSAAVLKKGGKGGAIDQSFSAAMAAAAGDPSFDAAIGKILAGYKGPDWQIA